MPVRALEPKSSASASFATSAKLYPWYRASLLSSVYFAIQSNHQQIQEILENRKKSFQISAENQLLIFLADPGSI